MSAAPAAVAEEPDAGGRSPLADVGLGVVASLVPFVGAVFLQDALHDPLVAVESRITVFRAVLLLCALAVTVPAVELLRPMRAARAPLDLSARAASVALGLVVGCVAGLWVALGTSTTLPRILGDELLYADLGKSMARGDGLVVRGIETYAFSVGYPAFLAPIYALSDSAVTAYHAVQVVQAYVMASAAVPVYLLARRALRRTWALAAGALSVLTPHLLLSTLVMTEPVSFTATMWFFLAAVRALEHPSLARQAVTLGALVVATSVRLQSVALAAALLTAVAIRPSAVGRRAELRRWLPTLALVGLVGLVAGIGAALDLVRPLGAYSTLLSLPDVTGAAVWSARTLGTVALAVGIVAAVGFVPGATVLLRGTRRESAIAALAVATIAWTVAVVGHFSATRYADDHVHERNVVTVLPLVLIVGLAWAQRGLPRPPAASIGGAIGVVACVAAIRRRDLLSTFDVDAPTLHVWRVIDAPTWPVSRVVVLVALVGAAVALSTRRVWVVPLVAALALLVALPTPPTGIARGATEALAWVDRAVGRDARVLVLTANLDDCERRQLEETALWAEMFNLSSVRAGHILRENGAANRDSPRMDVGPDGVVREDGRPVPDHYVALDARLRVDGAAVGRVPPNVLGDHPTARVGMTLWRVDRPLRILNPGLLAAGDGSAGCPGQG